MFKKSTEDLMQSLRSNAHLRAVLAQEGEFVAQPLHEALGALLREKGLTRAQVIQGSMLNTIYGHQIFAGTKRPRATNCWPSPSACA